VAANDHDKGPLLPHTAKSGQAGIVELPTPLSARQGVIGIEGIFCFHCGRAIPNPRPGQKFCRKALGQKGSCKDKYWSRGLRRLSELEKEVAYLADLINRKGIKAPPGEQI